MVKIKALVAQLVEQLPLKQTVAGSNPAGGTRIHENNYTESESRKL